MSNCGRTKRSMMLPMNAIAWRCLEGRAMALVVRQSGIVLASPVFNYEQFMTCSSALKPGDE